MLNFLKCLQPKLPIADGLCTKLVQEMPKLNLDNNSVEIENFREHGWVINEADVKIQEKIGKGEFGDVMLGNYKGQKVAIKVMKDMQPQRTKQFLAEATVMTSLQDDNLVCLKGKVFTVVDFQTTYYVINEACLWLINPPYTV